MTASLALYFKKEAKRDKSKEFDLKEDEIKKNGGEERTRKIKSKKAKKKRGRVAYNFVYPFDPDSSPLEICPKEIRMCVKLYY